MLHGVLNVLICFVFTELVTSFYTNKDLRYTRSICAMSTVSAGNILNSVSEGNCNMKREPAAVHHLRGFPRLSGPISE